MKFLRQFLGAVLLFAGLYLAVAVVVDPRGDFGTGQFPVITQDVRAIKMQRFIADRQRGNIDGLVLGSSRSMKLRPAELAAGSDLRFFNFAVDNARTEDYLAIYRWTRRQGAHPRLLIIGLDIEDLHDNNTPDRNLRWNDALNRELHHTPAPPILGETLARGKRVKSAFSVHYSAEIVRSLAARAHNADTTPFMDFEADGYLRYRRWEAEQSRGAFDYHAAVTGSVQEYQQRMMGMRALSSTRKDRVETLVREARADGVRVAIWLTPLHPRVRQRLSATTAYDALLADTQRWLGDLDRQGVMVIDCHDLSCLDKSPESWYDGAHVGEENARRLAKKLMMQWEGQHGF